MQALLPLYLVDHLLKPEVAARPVGAYGCTAELTPFMPGPLVVEDSGTYRLETPPQQAAKVREYLGNLQQVFKAYAWTRAMGAEGLAEASDLSVLLNNYMEKRLLTLRGVTRSHPEQTSPRLEMTRYSLGTLFEDTGVSAVDVQNRMADFGIDAFWLSHEPWIVPQPFTPEAGEMWSREDIDYWIDVLAHVIDEAYRDPERVRSAPHNLGCVAAKTGLAAQLFRHFVGCIAEGHDRLVDLGMRDDERRREGNGVG